MALVIKGNLPDSCGFCWECLGGGSGAYYCNRAKRHISDVVPPYDRRMEWCPIVGEIPDSHGRLISDTDVKALLRSGLSLDSDSDMDYVCGLIDGLPTITEATE